jgi:hypothetical protein
VIEIQLTVNRPVDPSPLKWKSDTALTSLPNKILGGLVSLGRQDEGGESITAGGEVSNLAPLLCYGCLTTLSVSQPASKDERSIPVHLPLWVRGHVRLHAVGEAEMKTQIGSYLLE